MKKLLPLGAVLSFGILIFAIQLSISSCTKDKTVTVHDTTTLTIIDTPAVCSVIGTYTGTTTASQGASTFGTSSTESYKLEANNLAVGYGVLTDPPLTFGGYTNTCDSVTINSYYTANSDYYVLKGVLLSNKTIISGSYQNVTNPTDFGTFSFTKQ